MQKVAVSLKVYIFIIRKKKRTVLYRKNKKKLQFTRTYKG